MAERLPGVGARGVCRGLFVRISGYLHGAEMWPFPRDPHRPKALHARSLSGQSFRCGKALSLGLWSDRVIQIYRQACGLLGW